MGLHDTTCWASATCSAAPHLLALPVGSGRTSGMVSLVSPCVRRQFKWYKIGMLMNFLTKHHKYRFPFSKVYHFSHGWLEIMILKSIFLEGSSLKRLPWFSTSTAPVGVISNLRVAVQGGHDQRWGAEPGWNKQNQSRWTMIHSDMLHFRMTSGTIRLVTSCSALLPKSPSFNSWCLAPPGVLPTEAVARVVQSSPLKAALTALITPASRLWQLRRRLSWLGSLRPQAMKEGAWCSFL